MVLRVRPGDSNNQVSGKVHHLRDLKRRGKSNQM